MITTPILMEDSMRISLRYDGPEVAAGEMDFDEVVTALQRFSGAYAKVASEVSPRFHHQIKIVAIRPGSFDLVIATAVYLHQVGGFEAIKSASEAAKQCSRQFLE